MNSMIYKKKSPLLIFLIPAFLFLIVFLYYPFIQNVINTFLNIGGLGRAADGVNQPWYENYQRLFTDPYMRVALKNTMLLILCTIVFQVGIALILALLVDTIRVGAQVFRTIYFFPIVISATALGLMFNLMFLYKGGMVNQMLLSWGQLDYEIKANGKMVVEWLDWKDQAHFLFTMFLPVMWQYITLPMLRNVLCTCLVLAITGALKVFDLPWVMFGAGMPENMGWLTGTYMYDQTFNRMNVDYGSTIAVLIVVLGVVLSQISNRVFKPSDDI